MQLPVFEHAYLLQSLGWAIANSFWQTGGLWLLYQIITLDKKIPALVKHHLSIMLLLGSFLWFVFTLAQNYRLLTNASASPELIISEEWVLRFQPLNNALPYLSIIYLLILCLYTLRFFRNFSFNCFLQRGGLTKAHIDLRLFTAKTALHLGIKKKIRVWLSEHVDTPSVTGFIKPVILLPAAIINQLSIRQTEAILLHELAHIRRNDYLVNFLQSVAELILFFNPFAVLLSKAARKERENSCDDWVLTFEYNKYDYAKALVVLEEQRHILLQSRFALTATNGRKYLLQRVKRLFSTPGETNFRTFQKFNLLGLSFLLIAGIFTALPYMINKPVNANAKGYNSKENLNQVKFDRPTRENTSNVILVSQPVKSVKEKVLLQNKNKIKRKPAIAPELDYVNAFINEELLNPVLQQEPIVTVVADKEITNSKFFVKIEEQQSGTIHTNTYYFELNNNEGNAAIKPLILLNKINASPGKTAPVNLNDSLHASKRVLIKKRITS